MSKNEIRQKEFRQKFEFATGGGEDVERFIRHVEAKHGLSYWDSFYLEPDPIAAAIDEFREYTGRKSP